jgi:ligand-binding sensor domain-containing protein
MTADYNGWTDAPEAEREALDLYSVQEFEREALVGFQAGSPTPHTYLMLVDSGRTSWPTRPS